MHCMVTRSESHSQAIRPTRSAHRIRHPEHAVSLDAKLCHPRVAQHCTLHDHPARARLPDVRMNTLCTESMTIEAVRKFQTAGTGGAATKVYLYLAGRTLHGGESSHASYGKHSKAEGRLTPYPS